jgi:predicted 3-demethylubiquinone-9 3-methyltransferase (glyoxalase superfamily)
MQKFTTFLMFVGEKCGKAEEAIEFYTSLFKNSEVINIQRHGPGTEEIEGSVQHLLFTLNGQEFMAMDSNREHNFTFTPATSIFVQCESDEELENAYQQMVQGGNILMPQDNYGFSQEFAWVQDRYGVSWQLNLA